jgi:hypothetical protein
MRETTTITWIPTEEEMPDADMEIIISLDSDEVTAGFWDGERWHYLDAGTIDCHDVIYWAEFPDFPKN